MKAHLLYPKIRSKTRTRRGRGYASGKGARSGRGNKGQKARAGFQIPVGFEGGQTKLARRIPKKRGFHNKFKVKALPINLGLIDRFYKEKELVSIATLQKKGLIGEKDKKVKIVAGGKLSKPLTFEKIPCSAAALEKIKKAGATVR